MPEDAQQEELLAKIQRLEQSLEDARKDAATLKERVDTMRITGDGFDGYGPDGIRFTGAEDGGVQGPDSVLRLVAYLKLDDNTIHYTNFLTDGSDGTVPP